jgi:uncharacterized protein (TIGR03086 family)
MILLPDQVFLRGLDFFTDAVQQLTADDWQRDSPCQGWRALDVLGHVGQATRFGTLLLEGAQPAWSPVEPPGASVEGSPPSWWDSLVAPARSAVGAADLSQEVDSPRGRRTVAEGLTFPAIDMFVHGWDVAKSAGHTPVIPADVIEFARHYFTPLPAEQMRSSRVFAAEKSAPASSDPSAAFIAWTGRDPDWQA